MFEIKYDKHYDFQQFVILVLLQIKNCKVNFEKSGSFI
ncbi:Uncharacterized protein dnm_070940 [Desulfonema magnum]|uniref:Uncharacterized protein n=1 Tax=Desulfonema magnum TaxID=45655 RepID=A0A975BTM8_9BACT|nr:Uncharacterized protein dnm_070940 [Desulfonema magnum]